MNNILLLVVSGVFHFTSASKDCGLDRLHPSAVTADSEYSTGLKAENLIDGKYNTYWYSANGDTYDNVYFDFSTYVDIKHIWIREGTYYIIAIYVYNSAGTTVGWTNSDDLEDFKHYNFWFPEFITNRVRIYFSGSQGSYLTVDEVSFWGCNMTSTSPTAIPTLSPSQMPTNSTPTVQPTMYPSVSPTQVPTNMTTSAPTVVPTLSPSWVPTMYPSVSPTQVPTSMTSRAPTGVPTMSPSQIPTNSIPTVLPTISPTDMPTDSLTPSIQPTVSPTQLPTISSAGTADSNDFIMIRVTELLGAVIFFLLVAVTFQSCKLRKRKKTTQQNAGDNEMQMALYNAAARAGQTDNTQYYAEEKAIHTNTTFNVAGENAISEGKQVSSQPGDICFALDKVSSADGTINDTPGGLTIGLQDSAL